MPGFFRPSLMSASSLALGRQNRPHVVVGNLDLQDPVAVGRGDLKQLGADLDRAAHQVLAGFPGRDDPVLRRANIHRLDLFLDDLDALLGALGRDLRLGPLRLDLEQFLVVLTRSQLFVCKSSERA